MKIEYDFDEPLELSKNILVYRKYHKLIFDECQDSLERKDLIDLSFDEVVQLSFILKSENVFANADECLAYERYKLELFYSDVTFTIYIPINRDDLCIGIHKAGLYFGSIYIKIEDRFKLLLYINAYIDWFTKIKYKDKF